MHSFIHVVPLSFRRHLSEGKGNHTSLQCSISRPKPHPLLTDREAQKEFLRTTWGRAPKLIRGLVSFDNPLSPDDLAGLATETPCARIIKGSGTGPYTLSLGPFTDETFQNLGESDWTLLVDHVNRFVPELSHLLDRFNFLPNWRLDDIMVSYAVPGGSVGPHVDNYDVFLIQGCGQRLWKTSYAPISAADERIVEGLDVRVLDGGFAPDDEWVLEPGDALYIPPRFPHHGISLDNQCMTYSVGFRAPTIASLVSGWADHIVESRSLHNTFYQDSVGDLVSSVGNAGRISPDAAERAYSLVMSHYLEGTKKDFLNWFAEEVSCPKNFIDEDPLPLSDEIDSVLERVFENRESFVVKQREGSVFAFIEDSDGASMYIDGERWPVANASIAAIVCDTRYRSAEDYAELASHYPSVRELLRTLLETGILYVPDFEKEEL